MNTNEKATLAQVEEQIKEIQKDYNYRLADFSIGELTKKFRRREDDFQEKEGEESNMSYIIVPKYQRDFLWESKMQSQFVESIFMGVPLQPLFAFELDEDGNLELLDGVQRISTIKDFSENKLELSDLEELDSLNGYKFGELEISRRRKFLNTTLKVYILGEKTDEGVRADIFRRVNETGKKLEPAEIRKGKFIENKFYDFILECTELPEFKSLFSSAKDNDKLRGEKEELVTRFFAYSDDYQLFVHSVKGFLDKYIIGMNGANFDNSIKERKLTELIRTLAFVTTHFPSGFRKTEGSKSIPRVRFEAISVGVNLALRENPNLLSPNLKWLESEEFKINTTSDAANNKNKLVRRIEFVRDCLLSKIDVNDLKYLK